MGPQLVREVPNQEMSLKRRDYEAAQLGTARHSPAVALAGRARPPSSRPGSRQDSPDLRERRDSRDGIQVTVTLKDDLGHEESLTGLVFAGWRCLLQGGRS